MKARKKVYFFEVEVRYEGNAPFPRTDRLRRWADKALSDHHHAPPCKSRLIRKNGKREEQAFLIKALWESLQSPHWNKDDLIDLGKLIFAKKSLKDIAAQDEKKFARIFPHLIEIAGQNEIWMKVSSSKA